MNGKKLPYCTAPECSQRNFTRRHFFKFPKEYDRWLRWVYACERLDLVDKGPEYAYRNCRLCHLHFEEKWYKVHKIRAHLHPDAIPTIFFRPGCKEQSITSDESKNENAVVKAIDRKPCTNITTQAQDKNCNTGTRKLTLSIAVIKIQTAKPSTSTQRPVNVEKPVNVKKPLPDSVKLQKLLLKNQKLRAQKKSLRQTIRRLRMKNKKISVTVNKDNTRD